MDELLRLIFNLVRIGTISAVDYSSEAPRVRIKTGELESNWVSWVEARAGKTKTWNPPSIGEQVVMLCPNGDLTQAVVLTALNSSDNPAPSNNPNYHVVRYPDGAEFIYDHESSSLSISGINKLNLNIAAEMNINCPAINIIGSILQKNGVIDSNGIIVDKHAHNRVTPGNSNTGGPV